MHLSETIKKIFENKTRYALPEHAIDQAESLKSLSRDLYTDSKRFIYELLQNADDSAFLNKKVAIHIRFVGNVLLLAHTGQPFNERDLKGICAVNHGTKKDSIEKTGYKGIGFKAVFGQSNKVIVYSQNNYFRFDEGYSFVWRSEWGKSQKEWEAQNERKFLYPWQIIPIETNEDEIPQEIKSFLSTGDWNVATLVYLNSTNDIKNAISELIGNVNMFLFLKNIEHIEFNTHKLYQISIYREEGIIKIKENGIQKVEWLSHSKQIKIPSDIKSQMANEQNIPDKLKKASQVELTLAAKIKDNQLVSLNQGEQLLYAYLPTDEKRYFFPVLVNASFLTSANRESLHIDSVWNQWLFRCIAIEIYKWIADLVKSEYQYQAYNLLPEKLHIKDALSNKYNEGINIALKSIPFIISEQRMLLTRDQAIQDFTFLSNKVLVGGGNIRQYIINRDNNASIAHTPFIAYTDFGNKFKELGVSSFEWEDMPGLLRLPQFKQNYTIAYNIEFIKYLKTLIEKENVSKVSNKTISSWEFIYDHKSELKNPSQIYFPAPDDHHWNEPDSELSFLHPDILKWLLTSPGHSIWLETLGVIEKTDLSYIQKTILANPSVYSTLENTIQTIQTIYKLYLDRNIDKELLNQLGELKILTKNGSLITANQCYFSDEYRPRLPLETLITEDIFVSESYLSDHHDKDEWRRFFKMIGVKEGIEILSYNEQTSTNRFVNLYKLSPGYFHESDKSFTPLINTFRADQYSDLHSLLFLSYSNNHPFAVKFWSDIISNIPLSEINELATAFWGNSGMPGRTSGSKVGNYIKWYTYNNECIPTKMQDCRKATDVFLNDESIIKLLDCYLPIFDGPKLPPDWKSFFQFKSQLTLSDYLELLSNIVDDATEKGKIKKENKERLQDVYNLLLDQTINWSNEDIAQVQEWAKSIKLPDNYGFLHAIDNLRYYADGDNSIFQDEFNFIFLNSSNRKHPYIENFLTILGIEVFKQENFNLSYNENDKLVSSLKNKLKTISPYLENWILSVEQSNADFPTANFHEKVKKIEIYEVPELKITYKSWEKIVQFHLKDDVLYVTSPWNSNVSLMYLPNKLCYYLGIKGFENELNFLLRSEGNEIQQHFKQEQIELPEQAITAEEKQTVEVVNTNEDRSEITPDDLISLGIETVDELKELLEKDLALSSSFFHSPTSSYDKLEYVQDIIRRAKTNIVAYLPTIGYDCSEATEIAPSIFGGIKKGGKDIYIVTRPSDGDIVLLHYTSEFDVLEYVNAEFWYEDGVNIPKQITFGQLLKKTGINRIPVRNTAISNSDVEALFNTPKSETLDFDPVPYAPQKIARTISSFANTKGGALIFGLKEIEPSSNEVVGLSVDFDVIDITKRAMSLLSPMPPITYEYKRNRDKDVFVIKTEKSDAGILFGDKKYIRKGTDSILEEKESKQELLLNNPKFKKTFAIIISIENYAQRDENQILKVKYASEDALKFKQVLIDVINVSEDDIFMFQDEKALKSNLEYELKSLFHYLTEDDRLIFYYVGHGFHDGVKNYLSTYDMHTFNIAETAIPLQKILLDPLKKSKCNNALIFIDACAKSFINENERAQISNINEEELLILTEEFPNYITFLSCQPGQSSYSSDVLQNGIWTHHLVEALHGDVKEIIINDKYITDRSLSNYLSRNVALYTKGELNHDQNPRAILDSSYENVIIEMN